MQWIETQHLEPSSNAIECFLIILSGFGKLAEVDVRSTNGCITEVDESVSYFRGCYLAQREIDHFRTPASMQCISVCTLPLQGSLKPIYFLNTLRMLVFILLPMLKVRWAAQAEIKKGGGAHCKPYSLLQYGEECRILAA